MNLSQLTERARYLAVVTTENTTPTGQTEVVLNEVYHDICAARDWPFTQSTETLTLVAGQAQYPMSALGLRSLRSLNVASTDTVSGRTIEPRNEAEMDALPYGTEQGKPAFYTLSYENGAETITFFPTPEEAETVIVRGYLTVPDLVAGTDVPLFRPQYHHAIAYEAAARMMAREGEDDEQVAEYRSIANGVMGQMVADYMVVRDSAPLVMSGRKRRRTVKSPFSTRRF